MQYRSAGFYPWTHAPVGGGGKRSSDNLGIQRSSIYRHILFLMVLYNITDEAQCRDTHLHHPWQNRDPIELVCYIHYGNLTKKWQWDGGKVSTIHWCFFVFVRLCKLHNRVQESWICTPSVNNISDVLFPCRLGSSRSLPLLWRVKVIGHWLPIRIAPIPT